MSTTSQAKDAVRTIDRATRKLHLVGAKAPKSHRHRPLVALTGREDKESMFTAWDSGVSAYLIFLRNKKYGYTLRDIDDILREQSQLRIRRSETHAQLFEMRRAA